MSFCLRRNRRFVSYEVLALSDPFEHLKLDRSTSKLLIPIRKEGDFDDLERKLRESYVDRIKARYINVDVSRVVEALRQSVIQKAIVETSKGPLERDPVCVFTRPICDEITCRAYAHTDEMINLWREKGAAVDLGLELATRGNLETVFRILKPLLYEHCGHGISEAFLGQNGERILDSANVHILEGCMVSAMACHSENIARLAIDHGCIGFHGFKKEFKVWTDISAGRLMFRILPRGRQLTPNDFQSAQNFVSLAMKSALIHDLDNTFILGDLGSRIASFGSIDRRKYYEIMSRGRPC